MDILDQPDTNIVLNLNVAISMDIRKGYIDSNICLKSNVNYLVWKIYAYI